MDDDLEKLMALAENLQKQIRELPAAKVNPRSAVLMAMIIILGVESGRENRIDMETLVKNMRPLLDMGFEVGRALAES